MLAALFHKLPRSILCPLPLLMALCGLWLALPGPGRVAGESAAAGSWRGLFAESSSPPLQFQRRRGWPEPCGRTALLSIQDLLLEEAAERIGDPD